MVALDFQLDRGWNRGLATADLAAADEMTLRYDLFLGDVVFRVDGSDFSMRGGWVPVLDFALSLQAIVEALATQPKELFEFTESEAAIHFTRMGDQVRLEASYAQPSAEVRYVELRGAVERFLARVLDELIAAHPDLARNPVIAPHARRIALD